ncbi:MAG: 1-(5-phosphoribosyl)-5-[(5-phosphoribosylamino)methylideneamino]imidazole-4-carboxamide isomerase [Roseiflexaceae bacterium]|nr:1-(5-phosphoribosyl)-5-[(5-phosphoribosylamino)methylideneamino]imidazole-4-carboxamide isomerase [Roseiflexaceae bacterium]
MHVIPAIDIKEGRCVRLYQGNFSQSTVYGEDPLEIARRWLAAGATRLHLVDLDGALAGHPVNTDTIIAIVRALPIPVQLGGGLRTEAAAHAAISLGVERVILGTAAVEDPEMLGRLAARFGEAIVVGIDAKDGLVKTAGWTEQVPILATDLATHMASVGVKRIIYTDISRDGTLTEPNFAATGALVRPGGPAIIASGGVCTVEHLAQLASLGVEAAIVGKALYTGMLDLSDAMFAAQ